MENKNKRRICEICNKSFANGKALGGHIRSHFTKLPIVSKSDPIRSDLVDAESDTESLKYSDLTRIRSKRAREQSVSSIFEDFPDEEAAMCLLKLKHDKWTKEVKPDTTIYISSSSGLKNSSKLKYKCHECKKRFGSYQALGGHRASHKSIKMDDVEEEEEEIGIFRNVDLKKKKKFECPFCDKVFESGKALGGHKKVHFSYLPIAKKPLVDDSGMRRRHLDLNLEPEEEDVEFSTVSY